MAPLYSLCAVALLVESIVTYGKATPGLLWRSLFPYPTLNARPAAYMTLPFLVLASWELFEGTPKARGRIVVLSAVAVTCIVVLA